MEVLGREVALVGVTLAALQAHHVPRREICQEIFAHHTSYSGAKLRRDVPEFHPVVALPTGMRHVFAAMEPRGEYRVRRARGGKITSLPSTARRLTRGQEASPRTVGGVAAERHRVVALAGAD
jgi:hypothetical protein